MRLCHIDELPDGGARGFDPQRCGQDSLLLVRQGDQVHAWADACPHHGTPMAWRKDAYLNAAGNRIVCAAHGALFEITTGLCTLGPCLGERLQALPITVLSGGDIHLADAQIQETHP
ncbi:(2Fe-2S)-binding protein [Pelomonas sp. HMWF004]|nr:(2Fe-2S)-binding protein [Pelomonas sp. HMWF004]